MATAAPHFPAFSKEARHGAQAPFVFLENKESGFASLKFCHFFELCQAFPLVAATLYVAGVTIANAAR